jgi:hypothetical protein
LESKRPLRNLLQNADQNYPLQAIIENEIRLKKQLTHWQTARYPALNTQEKRLSRSVTYRFKEWSNKLQSL